MFHIPTVLRCTAILLLFCPWGAAMAITRSMHADIAFVTSVELAVVRMPVLRESAAGRELSSGVIAITGASGQTVAIRADNYASGAGITPVAAMCRYGQSALVSCNDSSLAVLQVSAKALPLQLEVIAKQDGRAAPDALPGFDITIVYN